MLTTLRHKVTLEEIILRDIEYSISENMIWGYVVCDKDFESGHFVGYDVAAWEIVPEEVMV